MVRQGLFDNARTIWTYPYKIDPSTNFNPAKVRKQEVGADIRETMLPQTAYCRLKITTSSVSRNAGGRSVAVRQANDQGANDQGGAGGTGSPAGGSRRTVVSRSVRGKPTL